MKQLSFKNAVFFLVILFMICLSNHDATAQTDFITRWDLSKRGSGSTQLTFGGATRGTVNYIWQEVSPGTSSGSGSFNLGTSIGFITIAGLPVGATIDLSINPTNFKSFQFSYLGLLNDQERIIDVKQWGTTAWSDMLNAFKDCKNLNITAADIPNLAGVNSMASMFYDCFKLNGPANIDLWNVSTVNDMNSMFYRAVEFNQNIGSWDVSNVTNMDKMFHYASIFNQNIGLWNVSNVTTMFNMFASSNFNQDIGSWNISAVTDMRDLFEYSGFNQSLEAWGTKFNTNVLFSNFLLNCRMNLSNYDATLKGLNAGTLTGKSMRVDGRSYCASVADRANLVLATASGGKGWTIVGDANGCVTSTTEIISNPNPSTSGNNVTFTTRVYPNTATGTVTIKDGSTTIGTGTLFGGVTTFATSVLSVGTHSITAVYGGDGSSVLASTSTPLSQVVNGNPTTTSVSSSINPSISGNNITFTASVSPNTATGTLTFKDGSTPMGTEALSGGIATFVTSNLSVGTHSITAVYGGDATNASSTSVTLSQVVNAAVSTNIISINSGMWGDDSTWNLSRIPMIGDEVVIDTPHIVTLNGTGNAKSVLQKGKLILNTVSSILSLGF